jgi:hypothetical protein
MRIVACGLIVIVACARLDTQPVTPEELTAMHQASETGEAEWPSKVRATWPDGTKIVLEETRLEGDTLIGTYCGDLVGRCVRTEKRVALSDLESIEAVAADRRTAHGGGIAILLVSSAVAIGILAATLGGVWR